MSDRRLWGCEGKVAHETRDIAMRVRKRSCRSKAKGDPLKVYRCRHCGRWHIGSAPRRIWRR